MTTNEKEREEDREGGRERERGREREMHFCLKKEKRRSIFSVKK